MWQGKLWEKLLINRIEHFVQRNELLDCDQYGFTPHKSAIDAAVEVKDYLEEALREGQIVIMVTLDVQGAFVSAGWPNIITTLQKFECPKNLYKLTKSCFGERKGILSTNDIRIEKLVSEVCPQGVMLRTGLLEHTV